MEPEDRGGRVRESLRVGARRSLRVIDAHGGRWNTGLNAIGVLALVVLHVFGQLSAEVAGAGVLTLCGVWAVAAKATRG